MNKRNQLNLKRMYVGLALALALVALFAVLAATPTARAQGINTLSTRILRVLNYATVGTNLTVGNDLTVGNNLTVTGDSALANVDAAGITATGIQSSGNLTVTGDISTTGSINLAGTYVGITPVATATDISGGFSFTGNVDGVPTLSAGGVRADTGVYTTSVTIAGTPVIPYATPVLNMKCAAGTQNVAAGSATVIPATLTAAGITTPVSVSRGMAANPAVDHASVTHLNSAGVVTLNVWQLQTAGTATPQAATTTVAVDYTVCGR